MLMMVAHNKNHKTVPAVIKTLWFTYEGGDSLNDLNF